MTPKAKTKLVKTVVAVCLSGDMDRWVEEQARLSNFGAIDKLQYLRASKDEISRHFIRSRAAMKRFDDLLAYTESSAAAAIAAGYPSAEAADALHYYLDDQNMVDDECLVQYVDVDGWLQNMWSAFGAARPNAYGTLARLSGVIRREQAVGTATDAAAQNVTAAMQAQVPAKLIGRYLRGLIDNRDHLSLLAAAIRASAGSGLVADARLRRSIDGAMTARAAEPGFLDLLAAVQVAEEAELVTGTKS